VKLTRSQREIDDVSDCRTMSLSCTFPKYCTYFLKFKTSCNLEQSLSEQSIMHATILLISISTRNMKCLASPIIKIWLEIQN